MTEVGLFVPNQNNNRCPETGALLVFEDLLEIKEWLMGKSVIPVSKATPAFCLLDTFHQGTLLMFLYSRCKNPAINKYTHKICLQFWKNEFRGVCCIALDFSKCFLNNFQVQHQFYYNYLYL